MGLLNAIFGGKEKSVQLTKEQVAELLNTSPDALIAFEKAYSAVADKENAASNNLFKMNSRQAAAEMSSISSETINALVDRIVNELSIDTEKLLTDNSHSNGLVTREEIDVLPEELRPQCTGTLLKKDIATDSYPALLFNYKEWLKTGDEQYYHMFRQGLDLLDLDPVTYEILSMNPNSMSNWFYALKDACDKQDFFKIPETKIVKVPLPILQLTRCEYFGLTKTTLDIVDKWARKAFGLDPEKTYFIKTGCYSSKFDFRNAKVTTPSEVMEIGQYLLFIHWQALQMSHYDITGTDIPEKIQKILSLHNIADDAMYEDIIGYLKSRRIDDKTINTIVDDISNNIDIDDLDNMDTVKLVTKAALAHAGIHQKQPVIYGVSTTNEWVVREYIEDKENLPCIYHGMPLHTEYRAFIDFDTNELLGVIPYWDAESMKKRFSMESDYDTADMKHDYIIYCKEEKRLNDTFNANVEKVSAYLREMIPNINLKGQWSLDVMQNGDDFWLIDMALAANSALVNKLPMKLPMPKENWLPDFSKAN